MNNGFLLPISMYIDDYDDDVLILSCLQLCLLALLQKRNEKRTYNRRWWVRPINIARPIYGDYEHLFNEIKHDDPDIFSRYVRMRKETFYHLVQMTTPFLTKVSKRAFSPEQRLAITLRYLSNYFLYVLLNKRSCHIYSMLLYVVYYFVNVS